LLFARATLAPDTPVLFVTPAPAIEIRLDPARLRPGVTPARFAGRRRPSAASRCLRRFWV
jgi:hypothetical protein